MSVSVATRPAINGALWLSLATVSMAALSTGAVTLSYSDIVAALGAQLGSGAEVEPLVRAVLFIEEVVNTLKPVCATRG